MPQYKLMYFDARGRAEVIRMLFTLKGVEFEDFRMKKEEWPAIKENRELCPLGQVPVLLIDGKAMPHGKAVNRYLARMFGYYGKTDDETNVIELVAETVDDIVQKIYKVYHDKDEEKKAENMKEFKEKTSVLEFTYLSSLLNQNKGKFFLGEEISLADLQAFTILDAIILTMKVTDMLDAYPDLAAFYKMMNEDSPLASYIKSRPVTFF